MRVCELVEDQVPDVDAMLRLVSGLVGWLGVWFVLVHVGHFAVGDGDAGGDGEGLWPVGVDGAVAGDDVGVAVDAGDMNRLGRLAVSFGLTLA